MERALTFESSMKKKRFYLVGISIFVTVLMVLTGYAVLMPTTVSSRVGSASVSSYSNSLQPAAISTPLASASPASSTTPWAFSDYQNQEPGYTGGDYKIGVVGALCEGASIEETVSSVFPYYGRALVYQQGILQNASTGAYMPWMFSNWTSAYLPAGTTIFSPVTGTNQTVTEVYTVHLRNDVRWQDWTPANNNDTYVYSNQFYFYNSTGVKISHTYNYTPMTMRTYYLQAPDVILSWLICQTSYTSLVNILPVNNLTVQFYLSQNISALSMEVDNFYDYILPYHIWKNHAFATLPGDWNYTGQPNGYDQWQLGLNPTTGQIPGMIGTGPFMIAGNSALGVPSGDLLSNFNLTFFANPTFFAQYVNNPGYRALTPKVSEVQFIVYLSETDGITALSDHAVSFLGGGINPSDIPIVQGITDGKVLFQEPLSLNFITMNTTAGDAPYNITAFRQALNYATDKTYFMDTFGEGYGDVGQSALAPSDTPWYDPNVPQYSYNLSKAEAIIAAIPGMKMVSGNWQYFGKPVTASIDTFTSQVDPSIIEEDLILAQNWDSIGVPTKIVELPTATLYATYGARTGFQMVQSGFVTYSGFEGPDSLVYFYNPSYGFYGYFGPFSNVTYNGTQLSGPQVDNLLANLSVEVAVTNNISRTVAIADEIQYIGAEESSPIFTGFPDNIWGYQNSTFTGVTNNLLSDYCFLDNVIESVHLKPTVTVVSAVNKVDLSVGLSLNQHVVYSGQDAILTIQVRNQYGQPMPGMNVTVGFSPDVGIINVSAVSGVTNSAGQYIWKFQALPSNTFPVTPGYYSNITIEVAAYSNSSNIVASSSSINISVSPLPAYFELSGSQSLYSGSGYRYYNITVLNQSGKPISGYAYSVQTFTSLVNVTNVTGTLSYVTGSPTTMAISSAILNKTGVAVTSYKMTQVTGVTGSNGLISLMLELNGSSKIAYGSSSKSLLSYLFFGQYSLGEAVRGEFDYQSIGEMTSTQSTFGPGDVQPVEIPLAISQNESKYEVRLNVSNTSLAYNQPTTVTVSVVNALTDVPVPGVTVNLVDQNLLGPNRGYMYGANSVEFEAMNPNSLFGSTYIPGIQVTTNSTGVAVVTFNPGFFQANSVNGNFTGFSPMSYPLNYFVPFDAFMLSAEVNGSLVTSAIITSSAYYNNPVNTPVMYGYIQGAQYISNSQLVTAGNYTLYLNSTLDSAAGAVVGGVSFVVSSSYGNLSIASGTTNSSGSSVATITIGSVPFATNATLTISAVDSATGAVISTSHESLLILPTSIVKPKVTTTTTNLTLYYALIGVFVALTVIFGVMYLLERKKAPKPVSTAEPPKNN